MILSSYPVASFGEVFVQEPIVSFVEAHRPGILALAIICIAVSIAITAWVLYEMFPSWQRQRWLRDAGVPDSEIVEALYMDERYRAVGVLFRRFCGGPDFSGGSDLAGADEFLREHPLGTIRQAYRDCLAEERRRKTARTGERR